ncbi:MAG: UbiA family prenyltransferase [Desulfocapsaceae bacterium]|nr:UbiA family prenyltransferase [Desulfocapsaceae bacterium]
MTFIDKPTSACSPAGLWTLARYHLQIAKVPLCLLVAFSAFFGYLMAPSVPLEPGGFVFFGVLFLAAGSASLNSVQERLTDLSMGRTRGRPLARGLISRQAGQQQARLLLAAGFLVLWACFSSLGPLLAGISAVFLYNFIYTPLKHRSVWAIIPGAFCGALPPYIGWLAGGGFYGSTFIIAVMSLFLVWQIPHFWLVVLDNQQDYCSGDSPSLLKIIPAASLKFISIVWILALVIILHVIILLLVDLSQAGTAIISFGSLLFLFFYSYQLGLARHTSYRLLFIILNILMFSVMVVLTVCSGTGNF